MTIGITEYRQILGLKLRVRCAPDRGGGWSYVVEEFYRGKWRGRFSALLPYASVAQDAISDALVHMDAYARQQRMN